MGLATDGVVGFLLHHRLRFVTVAMGIVRNPQDADDVFQQVVLAAIQHRDSLTDQPHLLAWALRATRHRAIDLARRKNILSLSDDVLDLLVAEWGDPAVGDESDAAEALNDCLACLGPAAQDVLRWKFFDGLRVSAIAERLKRTPDAVYQMISRAQRALKACVEQRLSQPAVGGANP